MTSPRFDGSGLHRRNNTLGWLVALLAMLTAAPCLAQTTGTAPATGPDSSVAAPSDTAGGSRAGADSVAGAPGDTLARPARDTTGPPAPPAPPPAPVDSVLGEACAGTPGGPSDLLLVTFRPSTIESERLAVAGEVGGTLLGASEHAGPGSWYLRVPGDASERSVADRLILLPPVLEVESTRCPA